MSNEYLMYGEIGWDVNPSEFSQWVNDRKGQEVTIRINSPGGDAFAGIAMCSILRSHGAATVVVDGLAASAASVAAMGAKKRVMAPGAMMMIHNASGGAWGGADDMEKVAEVLRQLNDQIASLYAQASGGKIDQAGALSLMEDETWMDASKALEYGLCDAIDGAPVEAAAMVVPKKFNYRNCPVNRVEETMPQEKPEEAGIIARLAALISGNETADLRNQVTTLTASVSAKDAEIATLTASLAAKDQELAASKESATAASAEYLKNLRNAQQPIEQPDAVAKSHWEVYNSMPSGKERAEYLDKNREAILNTKPGRQA